MNFILSHIKLVERVMTFYLVASQFTEINWLPQYFLENLHVYTGKSTTNDFQPDKQDEKDQE